MKRFGPHIIFLAFGFLFCTALPALAQDAGMSDVEVIDGRESSEAAFTPGDELRFVPRANGTVDKKDSIVLQIHDFPMQRASQKPVEKANEKQPSKKDDSILTFNFLYYIIQKYKLQDIID
jgi:hypothetical protein